MRQHPGRFVGTGTGEAQDRVPTGYKSSSRTLFTKVWRPYSLSTAIQRTLRMSPAPDEIPTDYTRFIAASACDSCCMIHSNSGREPNIMCCMSR